MKKFHLTISSVSETKFDGNVVSVAVPGVLGEMEIYSGHEPIITTLKKGTIKVKDTENDLEEKITIEKGIVEAADNEVVILI